MLSRRCLFTSGKRYDRNGLVSPSLCVASASPRIRHRGTDRVEALRIPVTLSTARPSSASIEERLGSTAPAVTRWKPLRSRCGSRCARYRSRDAVLASSTCRRAGYRLSAWTTSTQTYTPRTGCRCPRCPGPRHQGMLVRARQWDATVRPSRGMRGGGSLSP